MSHNQPPYLEYTTAKQNILFGIAKGDACLRNPHRINAIFTAQEIQIDGGSIDAALTDLEYITYSEEAYHYGTQHGFLTLLDGIYDGSGIAPGGLLFVFAGAFPFLGEIISIRTDCNKTTHPVGFGHPYSTEPTASRLVDLLSCATAEDFVTYGLEAELMGRIPVLAPLLPLTENELVRILTEVDGSVCSQYTAFFSKLGVEFTLTPKAAQMLAYEAALVVAERGD